MLDAVASAKTTVDPVAQWQQINLLHAPIQAALDRELRAEHELSTVEYEVLAKLSQCDCDHQQTRVSALADLLRLNQSTPAPAGSARARTGGRANPPRRPRSPAERLGCAP